MSKIHIIGEREKGHMLCDHEQFRHQQGTCTTETACTCSCRCSQGGSCGHHAFQCCHHAGQNHVGSAWQSAIPGCGKQPRKWVFWLRVAALDIRMGLHIFLKSFQLSSTRRQKTYCHFQEGHLPSQADKPFNFHIFSEFTNSDGKNGIYWTYMGLAQVK